MYITLFKVKNIPLMSSALYYFTLRISRLQKIVEQRTFQFRLYTPNQNPLNPTLHHCWCGEEFSIHANHTNEVAFGIDIHHYPIDPRRIPILAASVCNQLHNEPNASRVQALSIMASFMLRVCPSHTHKSRSTFCATPSNRKVSVNICRPR